MGDLVVRAQQRLGRRRLAAVAGARRAAANGRRDGCALLAQVSVAAVAALVLWTGSGRLTDLLGPTAYPLVAAVWTTGLAGAVWWCRAFWSPQAAQRAAAAECAARVAAIRAGAAREDLGLSAPLDRVRASTGSLPAAQRGGLRRRALAVVHETEHVVADLVDAGHVEVDATGAIVARVPEHLDTAGALHELLQRRRLEVLALAEEADLSRGAGASVRARLAAQLEVERCDLTAPVAAMAAGGPS